MPVKESAESDWHGAEPQDDNDDCSILVTDKGWYNVDCSNTEYFLCEKRV